MGFLGFLGAPNVNTGSTGANQGSIALVINGVALPDLAIRDSFSPELLTKLHETTAQNYGGRVFRRVAPEGIKISVDMTRQNASVEKLAIALLNAYYANATMPVITATVTIVEQDDTVTEFSLTGGTIDPKALGKWSGNEQVKGQMMDLYFTDASAVNGTTNPFDGVFAG